METIFRDGLSEEFSGSIEVFLTSEGHTVEKYKLKSGAFRYFVTLAGTHWCAHGNTVAEAIADALWKDPKNRPSLETLKATIQNEGKNRRITLGEFRILTGACLAGCREALSSRGMDESPLTAFEIRDKVSREWGNKLISILGWEEVES